MIYDPGEINYSHRRGSLAGVAVDTLKDLHPCGEDCDLLPARLRGIRLTLVALRAAGRCLPTGETVNTLADI